MNARRSGPLIAVFFALLILPYPMMKLGPMLFSGSGASAPAGSGVFDSWGNPALSAEDAALEIVPGAMRLGDLVKLIRTAESDPVARAFADAFWEKSALHDGWQDYRKDRDAKKLRNLLVHSQDFAELFSRFQQRTDFRSSLAVVSRPEPAKLASAGAAGSPQGSSLHMVRASELAAPMPGARNMAALSADQSPASSGLHSGPGYDGEPQPGEAGDVSLPSIAGAASRGIAVEPAIGLKLSGTMDAVPGAIQSAGIVAPTGAQGTGTTSSVPAPVPAPAAAPPPSAPPPEPSASGSSSGNSNNFFNWLFGDGENGNGNGNGNGDGGDHHRSRRD